MRNLSRRVHGIGAAVTALLIMIGGLAGGATPDPQGPSDTAPPPGPTAAAQAKLQVRAANPATDHFDDVYYMLQHNSYEHGAKLTDWLDLGLRSLELDVIDKGDWNDNSNGPFVTHDGQEGKRNCSDDPARLGGCLKDVVAWQNAHPNTGPILIFVDMKASYAPGIAWGQQAVLNLDNKIHDILGSRMYTGNELYDYAAGTPYKSGASKTLRAAVGEKGWPLLNALNNKIVVAYTGGKIGLTNQTQGGGINKIVGTGRLPYGFFCPDVESDPNQLNPGNSLDGIDNADSQVAVCSNLESRDHYQVTANRSDQYHQLIHLWGAHVYSNDSYNYNYVAVAQGISAVGRDSSPSDTFDGAIPSVGVRRSVPGYFELRVTSDQSKCLDVSGGNISNGTKLIVWTCNGGTNEKFVYTAEGQLRPERDNKYCVDIKGGKAGPGNIVHAWNCDGGSSEKWVITSNATFKSYNNQSFCLDQRGGTSPANNSDVVVDQCGSQTQSFVLSPVADWLQTNF